MYGALSIIVLVAVFFGVRAVVSSIVPMTASGESPAAQPETAGMAAASTSASTASEDNGNGNYPDSESLAWRDEDFAVNPDKTDWNYESNGEKVVYLTIDDGPSEITQEVLDMLDKYDVKATFFVVGHNDDYFPLIAEAYKRGHTIGLHSMTHDYEQIYSSIDAYFEDLNAVGKVVEDQIGYVPCFIRFPGGSSNEISTSYSSGIMTRLAEQVQEQGYQYYDWNYSSGDGSDHSTEELISFSTEPTELENIMLLCHDSATKRTTLEALPTIIEHYQSLGYTFKAIDRDSVVVHHGINN